MIQLLNSVGALLLIYAIRAGKAVIVVPMINGLYPLITILLSLIIYHRVPNAQISREWSWRLSQYC